MKLGWKEFGSAAVSIMKEARGPLAVLALVVFVLLAAFSFMAPVLPPLYGFLAFVLVGVLLLFAMVVLVLYMRLTGRDGLLRDAAGNPVHDWIQPALEAACRAASLPAFPESAGIRAFLFVREDDQLVCRGLWAQNPTEERTGRTRFKLGMKGKDVPVVVEAFRNREVTFRPIQRSIEGLPGVKGPVSNRLRAVLAAPIIQQGSDEPWGTIDFDAELPAGARLLRTREAQAAAYALAKHFSHFGPPMPPDGP